MKLFAEFTSEPMRYTYLQIIQLRLVRSMSSEGTRMGTETLTGGLFVTTGLMVGAGGLGTVSVVGGAFLWARHSSSIAFNWSVASLSGECNNCIAFKNEASNENVDMALIE